MRSDHTEESRFERFLHWAEGEEADQGSEEAEDPERAEFVEYLEYIDSHEPMDFGAYRLMRMRERAAKGIPQPAVPGHHAVVEQRAVRAGGRKRGYRPGTLKKLVRVYRILSVCVTMVLMLTLLLVALSMPRFGDPEAPAINEVSQRYLEKGVEETGAVNAVAGMILDYRAFDTFGESTVLFAAAMSVVLLLRKTGKEDGQTAPCDSVLAQMGRLILPAVMMFGIYVVLNGHLSPGGGFSGGTVLGCGLILCSMILGSEEMERLLPPRRITAVTVTCLLAYGLMKGYSFFTGANHLGWEVPNGTPGAIFSAGFILPLNICVGIIVACTMYTFFTLFSQKEG